MQAILENKSKLTTLLFVLLSVFALTFVTACKEQTTGEKIENAADEFGDGVEDAAEEMQDRSAGEKMGDAIEDTGEEMQEMAE